MSQTKAVGKTKTHIWRPVIIFLKNRTVFEIMRKNVAEPDRPQMTT